MPRQNVELVRQVLEAYNQRDVDALRALNHPDLVLDWSASHGWLARVYRGIDDAVGFYTGYYEVFEETTITPDRLIEAGDSVVVPDALRAVGLGE